jgi:hypothetical protein
VGYVTQVQSSRREVVNVSQLVNGGGVTGWDGSR